MGAERRRDEDTPVTKLDNKIKPIDSSLRYSSYPAKVLAWIILTMEVASCYAIHRPSKNSLFLTLIVPVKNDT